MQTTPKASNSNLTDKQYWEMFWAGNTKRKIIRAFDGIWGKSGSFLKITADYCRSNDSVLELGGGYSKRLVSLAKFSRVNAVALDFAENALEATRQMAKDNGVSVKTLNMDMFCFEPGEQFDVVTHWGVLEHFEKPEEVMLKCADLTKSGGFVVFSMPNMQAAGAFFWRRFAPVNWSKHIFHSDEAVANACSAAGLKLLTVRHWHVPMIQCAPWESSTPLLKLLTFGQLLFLAIYHVVPIGHIGFRGISTERFFVAQKISHADD